ncbi:MAG: glycosyltransferase [Sphingomonas sp.]|uniref:glycosyltransferase n=1 Tax=Sphingomonas sp. TaxID=28214 RepID=UPI0025EAF240|nr:glycosyltransferase [Sphingomonas sp.]MBX3565276.1 glycosyltransferase [Sphingomonas sp.]
MKILLIIDYLGSGGAQRQITNLALGLQARGVTVTLAVYHFSDADIFRPAIEAAGIPIFNITKTSKYSLEVPAALRRAMKQGRYDAVISFLDAPNIYAELAKLGVPGQTLIVSERLSYLAETGWLFSRLRRVLHAIASVVVSNSHSQTEWLRRFPWLRRKARTIYNGYPITEYQPLDPPGAGPLKLLAVGRISPQKNPKALAQAFVDLHRKIGKIPQLTWVGRVESGADTLYRETCDIIDGYAPLKQNWVWAGEHSDVMPFFRDCHALVHPSLYEGLPNVVCEALMAGRPVLVSDMCDNALLAGRNRERGLVIPDLTAQAIATTMEALYDICDEQWRTWSANARDHAVNNLKIETMCDAYLALVQELVARRTPVTGGAGQ